MFWEILGSSWVVRGSASDSFAWFNMVLVVILSRSSGNSRWFWVALHG